MAPQRAVDPLHRGAPQAWPGDERHVGTGPRPAGSPDGLSHQTFRTVPDDRVPQLLAGDERESPRPGGFGWRSCGEHGEQVVCGTRPRREELVDLPRGADRDQGSPRALAAQPRSHGVVRQTGGRGPWRDGARGQRDRRRLPCGRGIRASSHACACSADTCASCMVPPAWSWVRLVGIHPGPEPADYSGAPPRVSTCRIKVGSPHVGTFYRSELHV